MPPPPKLSFMEEALPEAKPELEEGPSSDVGPPVELGVDIDLHVDTEQPLAPAEPAVPQPRRGVLPPPASDGKRVQPLTAKGQRTRSATKRPSASGLPSGMRAPGVPEETAAENTDVLIASAVAALTEGDPAEHSATLLTAEPPAVAEPLSPPPSAPQPSPPPEERKRRGFVFFGIAALLALIVLAVVLSGRSDQDPEEAVSPGEMAAAGPPPPTAPADAAQLEAESPQLPPPSVDVPPDVGGDWDEPEDKSDVGGALGAALDVGSDLDAAPIGEDAPEEEAQTDGDARPKSPRGRKRKRDPKEPTASTARPPPAAPAKQPADAAALLADARAALAAGKSRKAYSLASKSRSAKRTPAALVVMAKAACRFGGDSQAKSAFNQLSVTNRRGLRAECRTHGVRLGI